MIKAYHRVSSNSALKTVMEAGRIVPAAYRLDPGMIHELCEQDVGPRLDMASHAGQAIEELVGEAVAYFERAQREIPGTKTRATALKCIDILSGDAGRVFLAPASWSEVGRALGWPVSGFVFDAEELIHEGALVRKSDYFWAYSAALSDLLKEPSIGSVNEAKEWFTRRIGDIHEIGRAHV